MEQEITTDQAHAGEKDGEGNPVVDPEGDVVGGRLVLLEEVVLHPAHHVHVSVLLIRLQVRSKGRVTEVCLISRKVSRNDLAKIVRRKAEERSNRVGRKAETNFIELLRRMES
jgi:hypothetical protein